MPLIRSRVSYRCLRANVDIQQADGSFLLTKPHSGEAKIPMVVTNADTGAFVRALVESPPGINLLGYGSLLGWSEYTELWASILGVKASFKEVPREQYLSNMLPELAQEIGEGYAYHAEFGWDGGDPSVVHPKDVSFS